MTTENETLDHGDELITLEEIIESIRERPIFVRIRARILSALVEWAPENDAPDDRRPRRLIDVSDWIDP